jgi:hypothetical protein
MTLSFRNIIFLIVSIILLILFFSCRYIQARYAKATSIVIDSILQPTVFYPKTFDEQGRLYYYVKVFGVLKYFLSEKPDQDVNVLFLNYYQTIKNSLDKSNFNLNIQSLILTIHPDIRSMLQENAFTIDWANDTVYFDNITAEYISVIEYCFRQNKKKSFYVKQDNLGLVDIVNYEEIPHLNDSFPDESLRIWGLAEYWNYINYFWIHKKLMDNNWDSVLYVNIPNFVHSQDSKAYSLAIFKFIAYTDDTHVYFQRTKDTNIAGNYVSNVRLTKTGNLFIVKKFRTSRTLISSDTLLHVGDIIYSINGIDLQTYYDSLQYYFSASNPCAKVRKVCPYMIASFYDINKLVICRNGIMDTLEVLFCHHNDYDSYEYDGYDSVKNDETVQNIKDIGYLHIHKLFFNNMQKNLQILQQYEHIILDMRGYPNERVFLELTQNILPFGTSFFSSTYADIVDIGTIRITKGYNIGLWNKLKDKNIVILVDENTQSQAEFLVMALQQKPNVKVIGTPTAGADGNVIFLNFPGNIQTTLTGIGILYPDGSQTQRCGIKIDYPVNPTIEDYINTQDPILEYAIQYLDKK